MPSERDRLESEHTRPQPQGDRLLRPQRTTQEAAPPPEALESAPKSEQQSAAAKLRPDPNAEARSLDRVRPLLPELRLPPPTQADWHQAAYCADSCRAMAEILKSQHTLMEATRETKIAAGKNYNGTYAPHFQGDLGEITAHTQYSRFGDAKILNTPGKHDNHPHVDMTFVSESGNTNFSGDMKVSLTDRPQDYYMKKLAEFDELVQAGTLRPTEAQLFVPHDHVQGLREAVSQRFKIDQGENKTEPKKIVLSSQGHEWLSRIHETGLSSQQYRVIMEMCESPTNQRRIDIDRVQALADDLNTAADIIDRQLKRDPHA